MAEGVPGEWGERPGPLCRRLSADRRRRKQTSRHVLPKADVLFDARRNAVAGEDSQRLSRCHTRKILTADP